MAVKAREIKGRIEVEPYEGKSVEIFYVPDQDQLLKAGEWYKFTLQGFQRVEARDDQKRPG